MFFFGRLDICYKDGINRYTFDYIVCPKSLDLFRIVTYHMKWVKISWTYSTDLKKYTYCFFAPPPSIASFSKVEKEGDCSSCNLT